jgi:MinD-like ATPase involved in chromosome partitioning or flagellar assembly
MRPTHEDQGGPVTTSKPTPKISGPAAQDADSSDDNLPGRAAGRSGAIHQEGGSVVGEASVGGEAGEAGETGQETGTNPSGPALISAAYPQPAFYPHDLEYPQGRGYLPVSTDQAGPRNHQPAPGQPGYPAGPGYALDAGYELDAGYTRQLGYPQDPGYGPDSGYEPDSGYGPADGQAGDRGYLPDLGFTHDAAAGPPMEPLPDLEVPELPGPAAPQDTALRWDLSPAQAEAGVRAGLWEDVLAPPPEPAPAPAPRPADVRETSDALTTESLLHGKRAAPGSGWRRNVYRATGGLIRFGESPAEVRRRNLINQVRTPVAGGHHRVAVLSLKGGVGKTTTAVGLGATLATLRGDRVIAVDANPDRGTLSDKVRLETAATIRDLLNERDQVRRYADVRAFTSQAPSRLEVLASDRDPAVSVAFGADDYCDAARMLEHFYSICITDCGTGLLHSAMSGVLRLADQIVLVSSPSVDGARSASATLDWLEAHHCSDLVRNGVVVLSAIRPKSKSTVDLDRLEHHFAARCRAVTRIPYDPHLEEGAEVELEFLGSETADAYLSLAAIVGDGLARPRRLTSRSALS